MLKQMTDKCKEEIAVKTEQINSLRITEKDYTAKYLKEDNAMLRKLFTKERNKYSDKIYRLEGKIEELKTYNLSTSELKKIEKELTNFFKLKYECSLGSRNIVAIGFTKVIESFIKVNYTRWNGFMHNVKGCSGMANTISLHDIEVISEKEYNDLKKSKANKA